MTEEEQGELTGFPKAMKIDHVHFYVEDATSRNWFVRQLGFQIVASGVSNHTCTEVVKSGPVYFVLSSPLTPLSPVAEFLRQHPAGVADIAFLVQDVEAVMTKAIAHGAKVLQPIQQHQNGKGCFKWGKIAAWGSLTHTLIQRSVSVKEEGEKVVIPPLNGLKPPDSSVETLPISPEPHPPLSSFTGIDHLVLNVAAGDLERAVAWYNSTLDFQSKQTFKIQTDRSALHSQVMVSQNNWVQLPINQPASTLR